MAMILIIMIESAQHCTFPVWHISILTVMYTLLCGILIARDRTGFTAFTVDLETNYRVTL